MAYKPSDMLITLVVCAGLLGIMGLVFVGGAMTYNVEVSDTFFNETSTQLQTQLNNNVSQIATQTSNISSQSNLIDYFGGLIGQSWQAIKLTGNSIGMMTGLVNTATSSASVVLGGTAVYLKFMLIMIIMIIVFVAMLLRFIIKDQT